MRILSGHDPDPLAPRCSRAFRRRRLPSRRAGPPTPPRNPAHRWAPCDHGLWRPGFECESPARGPVLAPVLSCVIGRPGRRLYDGRGGCGSRLGGSPPAVFPPPRTGAIQAPMAAGRVGAAKTKKKKKKTTERAGAGPQEAAGTAGVRARWCLANPVETAGAQAACLWRRPAGRWRRPVGQLATTGSRWRGDGNGLRRADL